MENSIQDFIDARLEIRMHTISKRKIPSTYNKINDEIRKKLIMNVI